ncbi:hypothetical protein HDV05_003343 [Chytridiales sp. JEL 0842]|nr:hypothetical protein HDV05_003343 [Chytridiales sp. JEL 0842]
MLRRPPTHISFTLDDLKEFQEQRYLSQFAPGSATKSTSKRKSLQPLDSDILKRLDASNKSFAQDTLLPPNGRRQTPQNPPPLTTPTADFLEVRMTRSMNRHYNSDVRNANDPTSTHTLQFTPPLPPSTNLLDSLSFRSNYSGRTLESGLFGSLLRPGEAPAVSFARRRSGTPVRIASVYSEHEGGMEEEEDMADEEDTHGDEMVQESETAEHESEERGSESEDMGVDGDELEGDEAVEGDEGDTEALQEHDNEDEESGFEHGGLPGASMADSSDHEGHPDDDLVESSDDNELHARTGSSSLHRSTQNQGLSRSMLYPGAPHLPGFELEQERARRKKDMSVAQRLGL